MIIAVDFDGTCVEHDFPRIGKDIGAIPVLKDLVSAGHQLILFTVRSNIIHPEGSYISDKPGQYLDDAVNWFKENNIPLWGINENPQQKSWSTSKKPHADLFIDDMALGVPLIYPISLSIDKDERPYVDWISVRTWLEVKKYLPIKTF